MRGLFWSWSYSICLMFFTAGIAFGQGDDLSLSDMLNVTIVTSSKKEQNLAESTSAMTVISRQELERGGLNNLTDVLKRVPGFFASRQATWSTVIGRGLTADGTDQILLLIDGVPQNSIIGQGFQQQHLIPNMNIVERIEIIRGPGSVLWGSSAVVGVINIITKDQAKKENVAGVLYGSSGNQKAASFTQSFKADNFTGIIYFNRWQSDGFQTSKNDGRNLDFPWYGDWSTPAAAREFPVLDEQPYGYEIYAKVKSGKSFLLTSRILEQALIYPWDSWQSGEKSSLLLRKANVSAHRYYAPTKNVSVDVNVFGDITLQNRFPRKLFTELPNDKHERLQDQTNEELAYGAEVSSDIELGDGQAKVGAKYVTTQIGPNRDARFNSLTNEAKNSQTVDTKDSAGNSTTKTLSLPYIGVESGEDIIKAVYGEYTHRFASNTSVFLGSRVEQNNFREDGVVSLPRGGVIHKLSDNITLKALYNTGYLRPAAVYSKTRGVIVDADRGELAPILRVSKSEKIRSTDFQASWLASNTLLTLTMYQMMVENFVTFDATNTPQGYKNIGNVKNQGLEIEASQNIGNINVYGNISYAKQALDTVIHRGALTNDDKEVLNYPGRMINLGVSWLFAEGQSANVHARGWGDMAIQNGFYTRKDQSNYFEFGRLTGQAYLDLAYKLNLPYFELQAFAANVLDNQNAVGLVVNNGTYQAEGRNVGGRLTFMF